MGEACRGYRPLRWEFPGKPSGSQPQVSTVALCPQRRWALKLHSFLYKQTWPHPGDQETFNKLQTPAKKPTGVIMGFGDRKKWVQIFLAPLITSYVKLDTLFNFSELDFFS